MADPDPPCGGTQLSTVRKVCIEVEQENISVEVKLSNLPGISDVAEIRKAFKRRLQDYNQPFADCDFVFKRQSTDFPGKLTILSEDSPVKHLQIIYGSYVPEKASIPKAPDFSLSSMQNIGCTVVANGDTVLQSMTEEEFKALIELSRNANAEKADTLADLEVHDGTDDISKSLQQVSSTETGSTSEISSDSDVAEDVQRKKDKGKPVQSKAIFKDVGRFDRTRFCLPTCFGVAIDNKLKNKEPLIPEQYSKINRTLAEHMMQFTIKPETADFVYVLTKLFNTYPHLILENDLEANIRMRELEMRDVFKRERRKAGMQLSVKGGRPKRDKIVGNKYGNSGSSIVQAENATGPSSTPSLQLDLHSFKKHVTNMVKMSKKIGNESAIDELWDLTERERRHLIGSNKYKTIQIALTKCCPMLNQVPYLKKEMELILGKGICNLVKQKWIELVPKLLGVAIARNSNGIRKVLSSHIELDDNLEDQSFELKSRAALDVLPLLLCGAKQSFQLRRYFYDVREETANLLECLKKPIRGTPYLAKVGERHYIVAEGDPFLNLTEDSMDALVVLLCVYYTFNICWPKQVEPTFLFLQSEVLGIKDPKSKACKFLKNLLVLLKSEEEQQLIDEESFDTS